MSNIQDAIYVGSHEQSGVWEVLSDISSSLGVSREKAFALIQNELNFITSRNDIFFIKSQQLYQTAQCEVIDPETLAVLELEDVEFKEAGPFYYFSNVPGI
jgi:hypothetical protein